MSFAQTLKNIMVFFENFTGCKIRKKKKKKLYVQYSFFFKEANEQIHFIVTREHGDVLRKTHVAILEVLDLKLYCDRSLLLPFKPEYSRVGRNRYSLLPVEIGRSHLIYSCRETKQLNSSTNNK